MDTERPQVRREKDQLIAAIAENRRELARRLGSTADSLNLVQRVRRHFRDSAWKWMTAAVGTGLALGLLRPRPRPGGRGASGSLAGMIFRTAFTVLKPLGLLLLQRGIGSMPIAFGSNGGHPIRRPEAPVQPARRS